MTERDPHALIFTELIAALTAEVEIDLSVDVPPVRVDPGRSWRKGAPEVVLAEGKTLAQVLQAVEDLVTASGRVLVSRVDEDIVAGLAERFGDCVVNYVEGARTARVATEGSRQPNSGGRVGIVTAGSSDWPAAHEARLAAEEMGCRVSLVTDVGVAGLHRLFGPLRAMLRDVDVIIVAAGMDGALPSVIAGLVPVPVIGLPTAVGYGAGGRGEAALLSMLQTCAPGLTVVNIDNGIGAGVSAGMIANAIARARDEAKGTA